MKISRLIMLLADIMDMTGNVHVRVCKSAEEAEDGGSHMIKEVLMIEKHGYLIPLIITDEE